jgi:hypothetical protein
MSRVAPATAQVQRPAAAQVQRPAAAQVQLPAGNQVQRPATGAAQLPAAGGRQNLAAGAASGRTPLQPAQSFQRPSQGQVGDFLGLPQQSKSGAPGSPPPTASQLPSGGGSRTVTTAGGATITVGAKGGSGTTPGGAQVGGAGAAVKIEGPGGQTAVKGVGAVGASKGGYTAVKVGGGAAAGGTGRVGSVTAIRGPGGNTVVAGRGAAFANGQFVGGQTWRAVNGNFTRWNCFAPGWYGRYPGAWFPGRWAIASTAWAMTTWAVAGSYCGCGGAPAYYDYGENVIYQDGDVYYGDQPVATAAQYYAQACEIADAGATPQNEDWLPLGVFAVVAEGQTQAERIVQLALNKDGILRGNLYDTLTDSTLPIVGAVDKQTQRAAWKLEGKQSVVVETGLYDLTNDEVPVLVHFGPDREETRTLVRLQPSQEEISSATAQ